MIGEAGKIYVTNHHIDIYLGSKQFRSRTYREVPKYREIEAYEVQSMLKKDVIEQSLSEFS